LPGGLTVEKAVQSIKGGFSFRAKRELGFAGEIWQRGFSEVAIRDGDSFQSHRPYVEQNPVKAGLAASPEEYLYGSSLLKQLKRMKA
jgi:putative transposase